MAYRYAVLLFIIAFLASSALFKFTPLLISSAYLLLSLITYALYYKDKRAAEQGRWRTPENTLHTAAILGGWPGAILAQQQLRHKTKKRSFLIVFWLGVTINFSGLLYLHTPQGKSLLHQALAPLNTLAENTRNKGVQRAIKTLIQF